MRQAENRIITTFLMFFLIPCFSSSAFSEEQAGVLSPPANLRFVMKGNDLTILWDKAERASGYRIGLGAESGRYEFGTFDVGDTGIIGPVEMNLLPADSHYYLSVRSYRGNEESAFSNEIAIKAPPSSPGPFSLCRLADLLFDDLAGHYSRVSFGKILSLIPFLGVEPVVSVLIVRRPGLYSTIPNGILIDYKDGFTGEDGLFHTGLIALTFSKISVSRNEAVFYSVLVKDVHVDGMYLADGMLHGEAEVSGGSGSGVIARTIFTGVFYSAEGPVAISGEAFFDTELCPDYPVSGAVAANGPGAGEFIFFSGACDGSYKRYSFSIF